MDDARLTTVMGTARDVLATVGPDDGAGVLVDLYGWDATVQALAVLPGGTARAAFGHAWSLLLVDDEDGQHGATGAHHEGDGRRGGDPDVRHRRG